MRCSRIALGFVGGIGLALWLMLSLLVWFFRGWTPGGPQGGLESWQGWLCVLSPSAVFGYYCYVAAFPWSRRVFAVGLALHVALFGAVLILITYTDGGFLAMPMFAAGPVVWFPYAMKVSAKSKGGAS